MLCFFFFLPPSDPVTRALYDMVAGIVPDSIDEKRRINNMKRADAERVKGGGGE